MYTKWLQVLENIIVTDKKKMNWKSIVEAMGFFMQCANVLPGILFTYVFRQILFQNDTKGNDKVQCWRPVTVILIDVHYHNILWISRNNQQI